MIHMFRSLANDADVDCVVPWAMPCGEDKYRTCFDCPHFNNDNFHMDCDLDYDISDIVDEARK